MYWVWQTWCPIPWLAPSSIEPLVQAAIASTDPSWHCKWASRSLRSLRQRSRPGTSIPRAFLANSSDEDVVPAIAQSVSTQWSTARTPVLIHIELGVFPASSGSKMTSCGPRRGAWKLYFRREISSVPPAKLEYSPADSEVGTEMIGTVGSLIFALLFGPSASVSSPSGLLTSLARAWSRS